MSIKVGVRLRPFNKREIELNEKNIISMMDDKTVIHQLETGKKNEFIFDYSLWSFDGFEVDANGYCRASTSKYMDQEKVYNAMGKQIVENCLQGYHCCLFAYGQTGSGKSYSMMGTSANKGIIPTSLN